MKKQLEQTAETVNDILGKPTDLETYLRIYENLNPINLTVEDEEVRTVEAINIAKCFIFVIDEYREVMPKSTEGLELFLTDLILSISLSKKY